MPRGVWPRPSTRSRYFAKVTVGHPDGCWGWNGSTDVFGYGQVQHEGRLQPAHRVAWSVLVGPIPDGMWVLHHCDNPPCTNPDHLFLGTRLDNMRDAAAKGRLGTRVKLTQGQVETIRTSSAKGVDLAREFAVSDSLISMIRSGQRRTHPTQEA